MLNTQNYSTKFVIQLYDDSTKTYTQIEQVFNTDCLTWMDLKEVFNRFLLGAGYVSNNNFTELPDNDLLTEEEQAA